MIKPLIDKFQIDNPDAKCRTVNEWIKSNKKVCSEDLLGNPTIVIKGNSEASGTYFHPSIVSQVLAWVCEDLKKMIFSIFENTIVDQNQLNVNHLDAYEEENSSGII
jgi:hypothetical protein